ncbi:MAG: glycerophosphoryl diester phosphodiesterase [Micavibrio aeruginosavorus]|uniref:Glycerophosphoryl diester phosphodiesterase n=1 Tax=Micavibrio aeruginosavorus TaxID=349221 RepID=A0A7T5UGN7_9BACT|nr:MAG: glycerophosphoryl diester phosphodiesterase [Micavibrio aeruginosavorus]
MPLKLPKIIGHRGACGYAPENTLESVKTAADLGATWVELDVKLTKDDVAIIFHDDELDRTTNGSGLVADTLYEDIKQLEAGSWFSDGFSGIKIPTLEEMLELLIDLDLGLNLEIKPCPGREVQTAEAALDILSRYWDDPDKLLISSFQHVSLEVTKDMAAEWPRGLLLDDEWIPNWKDLAEYLEVATINVNGNLVTREQVEDIIDYGKPILAYTINDPQRFRTLQSWGVDGVFTDVPDIIKDAILTVH